MSSSISRIRVLAFGASLTEGFYADGTRFHPYTIRLGQLLRSKFDQVDIVNAGVSGEAVLSGTMFERLKNLLRTEKNSSFDWVCLLAGTNDTIRDQVAAQWVFDGYQRLINEIHQHGAKTLAMTLPETFVPRNAREDRQRQEFNRLIREELIKTNPEKKIVVLDVDKLLPQHDLNPDERKLIWDDGVHLTPTGYDRLADLIYPIVC